MGSDFKLGTFDLGQGRYGVAEADVKTLLASVGIAVPAGRVAATAGETAGAATGLKAPLVLKAFGPGLLHESDVGAVRLGLAAEQLVGAADEMAKRLGAAGLGAAGFLVEEQQGTEEGGSDGIELLIGVVQRDPFGPVVALGLGGTATEVLDQVGLAVLPLDERTARRLIRDFPAAALLRGARGAAPVDEEALVRFLLLLAGSGGVAERFGSRLAELECNPVLASSRGVIALDARLVLRTPVEPVPPPPRTDFTALFKPSGIVVAGASAERSGFGDRALAAYRAVGWTDGLFAPHPTSTEIDGVPAYPDLGQIPAPVDYLLVAVPAPRCAEVVRSAAGHVRFVQVISGGFGEAGPDGEALGQGLVAAARDSGVRLVGPNCMGVYSPGGRQTLLLGAPEAVGPVSIVSQSGGLAGDIIKGGAQRGVRFSKLASVGNAVDVGPGELVDWLIDDPETGIVGMYLEGAEDGRRLAAALQRARGRVPVVLLLGGQSRQGAVAIASHTGALVGDRRVWEALAADSGATLVTTLEDLLAVVAHLQRWHGVACADDPGVLVLGVGGGASVLGADACDRAGLILTPTIDPVRDILRRLGYGVGTNATNPLEIPLGPLAPEGTLAGVLGPVIEVQPYVDVLVHFNVQAYYSYGAGGIAPMLAQLDELASLDWSATRLAVVARNAECATGGDSVALDQAAAALGIPLYRHFDEAATAIAAAKRFTAAAALTHTGSLRHTS